MKKHQPVIGLEIHVELKTQAKMFCQCPADYFGRKPNIQTCPVCLGLPGALPVPNRKAVEWTMLIGKALNCQINKISKFDRKHYFYPDLPKGYQISQYDQPIATQGYFKSKVQSASWRTKSKVEIEEKKIRICRVHLEEDTGKLIHLDDETLIDFNRSGVPLVEIVTEPDFDNSDDVKFFLEELQVILRYLDVSDCDMEKGTMRLEPNISVQEIRNPKSEIRNKFKIQNSKNKNCNLPSYKVEIKNINSFKFVKQAIDYEIKRQIEILEKGKIPVQETRGFNEKKGITYSQRTKEEAHDYRYFPEPDIPTMVFNDVFLSKIVVPELPQEKLERYLSDFKIKYESAYVLIRDRKLAQYYEQISSKCNPPAGGQSAKSQLKTKNLYQEIANFIINKKISTNISAEDFIKKALEKLTLKTIDEASLNSVANEIIKKNSKAVEDYKKGKQNVLMFLVGQVMKELKGQADAQAIKRKIEELIKKE